MKKIISPIVLVVLLVWTWQVINSQSAIGLETHSGVQLKLAELIGNTLVAKKPDAENLKIIKLWTSELSPNKIQAVFTYQFTENGEGGEKAEKTIQGEALLYREPSEDPSLDKWTLMSVKTQLESMNFSEGSTVFPEDPNAPAEVPSPETPTK